MKIKYYAWVKDITEKDYEFIDDNYPKSISELKQILNKSYPGLKKHLSEDVLRYAVNMEYVSKNQILNLTDEVAVFPPVSGG
tara:strand:+ start:50 stop:295 length:246 start_codon:yes stop_codon:yes gene_type:complete